MMAISRGWRSLLVLSVFVFLVCNSGAFKHSREDLCHDDDDDDDTSGYNTGGGPVADKLNVHLVPHTHDDVGWLKTVDQYFVGSNNSIQVAAVQYIIDSIVDALENNPDRKFIYVEQAFFQRWWRVQSKSKQKLVKGLVDSGQLEFINGGWCMHDEATTHYIDTIDQTTLGHRYIKKQFNKVPRVGWQIDPFGHSAAQGYLLAAEVGFDGVFFARADYQDKEQRLKDRTMEFIWRGSKSLGSSAEVFGWLLHNHYSPPDEFSYEIHGTSPVIQDDPQLYDYNVQERVDVFVKTALEQGEHFRTNHIMWTMGEDFAYEYAMTWFKQMDKLIHYVNKDGRVNAFYSTPSIYVDSKHAANETWPLKTGDFFPYANDASAYWTGYFSSRPALKRYVRKLTGFLQAARQLEFLVGKQESGPNTDALEDAMGIAQHHDGVSGTEKQHVANDYTKRLCRGATEAAEVINAALGKLISGNLGSRRRSSGDLIRQQPMDGSLERIVLPSDRKKGTVKFEQCFLLNISYCPPSEADLSQGKTLVVMAYNPLGWATKEIIRIPVISTSLEVRDADGQTIPSQLVPLTRIARGLRDQYVKAYAGVSPPQGPLSFLVFQASVPPLGFSTFHIKQSSTSSQHSAKQSFVQEVKQTEGRVHLRSRHTQIQFSLASGRLEKIRNLLTGTTTAIAQSYCWYNSSDGNTEKTRYQAGGAYIFRPNTSTCFPVGNKDDVVPLTVVRGPLVEEVHQEFSPWISQVVRLYKDAEHAEVEFLVGPVPIDDDFGKEVVTKLTTNIQSDGEFYTDSGGRDFLKRVRDYREDWNLEVSEPVAGNYYPLNLGAYLSDTESDFSVLVDRSLAGSSINDGELELLLHRRLLYDDNKGVSEVLNETVCTGEPETCKGLVVQGTYYLRVGSKAKAPRWRRSYGQQILSPLQLAFTLYEDSTGFVGSTSKFTTVANGYQLPANVALITLQELDDESVLLRLAHLYEVDEDEELSAVTTVDLRGLFGDKKIETIKELTLTANQKKSDWKPLQWNVEGESVTSKPVRGRPLKQEKWMRDEEILVELGPHEIRTFQVSFDD
ncbi:unnamed protein product [Calypogeia fissa]